MRRLVNGFLWLLGLVVVLVVYFLVPLGRYTLYEHTLRIAATEPAQELGDELGEAGRRVGETAIDEWEDREAIREGATGGDDPLRLRVGEDGAVRLGGEVVALDELPGRIQQARESAEELRAILEVIDGAPPSAVEEVERVLREERVSLVSARAPADTPAP